MSLTFPEQIVASAKGWIGTPYVHQASCKGAGTDCLGLLRGVWREVLGAEPELVPAYTKDWSELTGEEVLLQAAQRYLTQKPPESAELGDVLLFRMRDRGVAKHLGIQTGADRFVHAYSGHAVVENSLSTPWLRRLVARFAFPEGDY